MAETAAISTFPACSRGVLAARFKPSRGFSSRQVWYPHKSVAGIRWTATSCQWNKISPTDVLSAAFLPRDMDSGMDAVCQAASKCEGEVCLGRE